MRLDTSDEESISNIYIKDKPLVNGNDDDFEAQQIAEILKNSINESTLPLHISLLGQWGSGKTTVINLLSNILDAKHELKTISVWKFADDAPSLHRKIVREIESQLNIKNEEGLSEQTTTNQQSTSNNAITNLFNIRKLPEFKWVILSASLLWVLLVVLQFFIPFLGLIVSNSIMVFIAGFLFILGKVTIDLSTTFSKQKSILPLSHNDQYENRFKKGIDMYFGKDKDKKLVLVFDDLDRLPPTQLYGALNTIRTFLSSERCAFIIPCDEQILKKELKQAFKDKDMHSFDVTEYLNKTFDITVRLPVLEQVNMNRYAHRKLEEEQVKWYRENASKYQDLLFILIHSNVKTPRHVKKILNAFAADWELGLRRDRKNKNGKFLTLKPETLAVFTVLKTDFNDFYNLISVDPFLIRTLIDEDEETFIELTENIQHKDLLKAFLTRIENLIPLDPRPFIYFNNELLNPLTGRKELEIAKDLITNGQVDEFRDYYKEISSEELPLVFKSVIQDINSSLYLKKILNVLFDIPELLEYFEVSDKKKLEENIKIHDALDTLIEYDLSNSVKGLKILTEQLTPLWYNFEEALIKKKSKHLELLNLYKSNSDIASLLSNKLINALYSNCLYIGKQSQDIFYLPKSILEIDENHILVNEINWSKTLIKTLEFIDSEREEVSEDESSINNKYKLSINLVELVKAIDLKSNTIISLRELNDILELTLDNFNEDDYLVKSLKNLMQFWVGKFKDNIDGSTLNRFLSILHRLAPFLTEQDFMFIGETINSHYEMVEDLEELTGLVDLTRDYLQLDDFDKFMDVIKDIVPLLDYCLEKLTFKETKEDNAYLNLVINNINELSLDQIENLLKTANTKIFNEGNSADTLNKLVVHSQEIKSEANKYKEKWFKSKSNVWLNRDPNSQEYVSKLRLNSYLDEEHFVKNTLQDMKKLINIHLEAPRNRNYMYVSEWKSHLQTLTEFYLDNFDKKIIWEAFLEELWNVDVAGSSNNSNIFVHLNEKTKERFLSEVPNSIVLDHINLNNLLSEEFNPSNTKHIAHLLSRWSYLEPVQRIDITSALEDEGFKELISVIQVEPNSKYISEAYDYDFDQEEKKVIIHNIIINLSKGALEKWLADSLIKLNDEGINKAETFAVRLVIDNREDIINIEPQQVIPLLSFQDERTTIALLIIDKFVPRNQKFLWKEFKDKIIELEELKEFTADVRKIKNKFTWRNTRRKKR